MAWKETFTIYSALFKSEFKPYSGLSPEFLRMVLSEAQHISIKAGQPVELKQGDVFLEGIYNNQISFMVSSEIALMVSSEISLMVSNEISFMVSSEIAFMVSSEIAFMVSKHY